MESLPKQGLYRERSSENIQPKLEKMQRLERGASPKNELSSEEREDVLNFENTLGEELESIFSITPVTSTISLNYLKTPAGQADFESVFGQTIPEGEVTYDQLREYLYKNEATLKSVSPKIRKEFEGRAKNHTEKTMAAELSKTLTEDLHIDCSIMTMPVSGSVLLTPEKSLEKISKLRELKQELKNQYVTEKEETPEIAEVKRGLIDIYMQRINEMIASASQTGRSLRRKVELGIELTEAEQALLNNIYDVEDHDRITARYDKFKHGASTETNAAGDYMQIGSTLAEFTEQYAEGYNQSIVSAHEMMLGKGLDPAKVEDENGYQPNEIRVLAEEILSSYNLLSDENPDTYNPTRSGPAADDKWQVIVSDQFNSMSANGKRKVVKIPNKPMSAKKLFTVGLAHEIEGHALQHTNKSKLGLRLFQKVGSDRSVIFAEGGAKFNEDFVSREAFGVSSTSLPHYIRGMQTKLNGGTFKDCVNTIYESSIEPYRTLYASGQLTKEEVDKIVNKQLELAVNRTRRLFSGGEDTSSETGQLTSSKDTAYIEGLILSRKLSEAHLQKYMFLTGINLDALIFLLENDLISTEDIQGPTYKSLEIWERERGRFEAKT